MKVVLYARVSKADSDQDPETQLLKLRAYAESQGWQIHKEYVDFKSGADPYRPQFDAMMREVKARRIKAVLATKLDRIMRNSRHLQNWLADLHDRKAALVLTDMGMDTTKPGGKLLFDIVGAYAEFELELIRSRTKDGLVRARAKGTKLGRPKDSRTTKKILQLRKEGKSIREIAVDMDMSYGAVKNRILRAK